MKRLVASLLLAAFALSGCGGSLPPYGNEEAPGSPWANDSNFRAPPT